MGTIWGIRTVSLLVLWLSLGLAQDPGPPTWPDGAVMAITPMGLGNLLLSWPVAENNVYELIGYNVYMAASQSAEAPLDLLYNGTGIVTVRQYMVTDLVPGEVYSFYIEALNTDPTYTFVLKSSFLFRTYSLASPIGLDPTVLDSTTFSITAGATVTLDIHGRQPSTGNLQDIGPICLVTEKASCVPGRTFVAFIQPPCELADLDSTCKTLNEGGLFNSESLPFVSDYYGPLSVAYDENNVGQYKVEITGERSGTLSLGLHAITPNQLLGLYWGNPNFLGEPADTRTDASIDFNWAAGAIVAWVSEFVSVRWMGYLKPESSGEYLFSCVANTYCDVWVDNVVLIASNQTSCVNGCNSSFPLSLKRAHYYRLRVDYVTTTGNSFISFQWQESMNQLYPTFTPIPSSVFQRGSYVAQSPLTVIVSPGRVVAATSFVYGSDEALYTPFAGKVYTLFVQVKDEYGNPCSQYNATDTITLSDGMFSLIATPYNFSQSDCVYSTSVTYITVGPRELEVRVNGEPVSNSPVHVDVISGIFSPLTTQYPDPSLLTPIAGDPFNVTIYPRDAFGNVIPNLSTAGGDVWRIRFEKDWSVLETSNCGSRSNVTWKIFCWLNDFVYVDDSLLIAQTYSPFYCSDSNYTVNSDGTVTLFGIVSFYQGPHILSVQVGDTLLSGSPLSLNVSAMGTVLEVDPALCLVQFKEPPSPVIVYETDVAALVLIRDKAGNVLYNRDDVDVKMVFDSGHTTDCTYVPNRYYECNSYANTEGLNVVSVKVNGEVASVTAGVPPSPDACLEVPFCGSPACPCNQQRLPAVRALDVISP